ncbi:uncharacterized protein LOC130994094 [Salvia miltiorrhiza]|uniref:uncharacterized protein LOC130994094 n=1 Tax=Salvia miltiorrhiza TaxID=226208 RepID=UPI0025AD2B95|nr:uncharacterized protein LOC130994094 [Salvia miltiorrhiza]
MRNRLNQTVANYFYDGIWHFSQDFIDEFPHIVCDILLLPIGDDEDVRLWKPSVHGDVTSALAFAANCHRFPCVSWGRWLWENYIPRLKTFVMFSGLAIKCNRSGLNSWSIKWSSQINVFWKLGVVSVIWAIWNARNKSHFDGVYFQSRAILSFIKSAFLEVENSFAKIGCTNNTWADYLITRNLGVKVKQRPPSEFASVYWSPPAFAWIKANTDGSAVGAPGRICAGGVFRDWRGFVRGCFHVEGGTGYAFEAELLGIITAMPIIVAG